MHQAQTPAYVIGLEVGGARIRGVAMDSDGTLVHTGYRQTRVGRGPDAVLETVLEYAADLARRYPPAAAGIAVPGLVEEAAGLSVFSAHLGWRQMPVRRWLAEELGVPVAFGHDARVGALAEARLGAGRKSRSFLFVPVGTGIGASMVHQGHALADPDGRTGELGHALVRPGGDPCPCGSRGCLETVASAAAIARRYRLLTGGTGITAREVQRRAEAGDPAAARIWREAVEALADGLSPVVDLLGPERIVIGGALAQAGKSYFDALRTALATRLALRRPPRLVAARFGRQAGVMGAALLARQLRPSRPGPPRPQLS
ncbi:ROK family protein [Kitasatospora sp. McL0602]|uniref:ROK family protein n=1 Tax=Kitasatospora sp. McL0602 TaxID=3439530 RepID=UPI003F8A1DFD